MNNETLIRKAQAAYKREWRRRNPGREAEYRRRFWLRKVSELNGDSKNHELPPEAANGGAGNE